MRRSQSQVLTVCLLMGAFAAGAPAQTTTSAAEPSGGAAPRATTAPATAAAPLGASAPATRAASRPASAPTTMALPPRRPAPPVPEADRLAAESLLQSADSLLYTPSDTRGKAGRIEAMSRMADKLRPGDFDTNWLLAGIYQAQGESNETERALGICFACNPSDCLMGMRYLRLNQDMLDTAEEKLAFLRTFVKNQQLPDSLRARAYADMGLVLRGQGKTTEARSAFEEAVKLDPSQPEAAQGKLALWKDATVVDRLKLTLAVVRGNPRNADLVKQAAMLLGQAGLYAQSLPFYEHALRMADLTGDRRFRQQLLPLYCDAMLDANLAREAITLFVPLLEETPSTELQSLLAEAYQAVNDPVRPGQMRARMKTVLLDEEKASGNTGVFARELAWYYEFTSPDANLALPYAQQAAEKDPEDPIIQRILGIAEMLSGKTKEGVDALAPLAKTDVYAARTLADYYLNPRAGGGEPNSGSLGRQFIRDGLAATRVGPAARQLFAMAVRNGVEIPPAPGMAEARELYDGFDQRYLEMPRQPGKYLSVTMQPTKDPVLPAEAIWVEATMTNISPLEIPLGDEGLVDPRLSMQVSVPTVPEPFANLPVLTWPAPRYLPPGAVLSARIRLDAGAFGRHLAQHPLDDISMNILPTLDPVRRGDQFVSSLPGLTVFAATLSRKSLVPPADANLPLLQAQALSTQLGHIVYDLQNGDLPARMMAVRQTACLLALERLYETGKTSLPKPVAAALAKGVLLRMVVEALKDPSDLIRAEMLSAMTAVPLDSVIVKQLASAIGDVSPLVRMRLVELLGASGLPNQEPVLGYFAKDPDELVRLMASAFASPGKPKKG
jgi:tetratricopeptide (TPR) repeat protein